MTTTLVYPFPATPLDEPRVQLVHDELAALDAAHRLFEHRPVLLEMAAVFLTHCSPPAPARDALEVVTRVLYLVLYFNDRVRAGHLATEASAAWAKLLGRHLPEGIESRCCPGLLAASRDAGAALHAAFELRGADLTSFAHLFRVNLAAFAWATDRHTIPVTVAEHLEVRQETISAIAYLRLWGLLGGLEPADELRYGLHMQRVERLSSLVQALANDLRSIERDRRDGEPNAVLLEESGGVVASNEAEVRVAARHADALAALIDALAVAGRVGATASSAFHAYLTFVGICTRGNNTSMDDLVKRYR